MISDQLKDIKYYQQNKKKFNRQYNSIWKKIAGPLYIGLCSYIFQTFYKEWKKSHSEYPTPKDFAIYYFSHVNPDDRENRLRKEGSRYYGRNVDQLTELAKFYMESCQNYDITLEEYFDDIVNHAIIETYYGQMREIKLTDTYNKHGFDVEHTNGYWDKDLGVDMIIRKNGKILDYIQCKPITTFLGNTNASLVEDRKNFYHKEEDKKKECNKLGYPYYPTKFILYNEEYPDKWCILNNKKSFHLEDLCDINGLALHSMNDFSYK